MRPWLLRPAWVGKDSTRLFSGSWAVTSSNPLMVMKRRPGLVGLNFLSGILVSLHAPEEAFDLLAFAERDDCLLPAGGVAGHAPGAQVATALPAHGHRIDVLDPDDLGDVLLLEGLLDVGLGCAWSDLEGVPTLRIQLVSALGDHRADYDLGCIAGGHSASPPAAVDAFGRCGRLKVSSSRSRQSLASNR